MASLDRLVWIDCEMTGLDPQVDELVEVAVVITDFELNVLDPGFAVVVQPSAAALDQMDDFVRNMHASSGLDQEFAGGLQRAEAELQVLDYITKFVPDAGTAPIAGNTIGTDRMFLAAQMPAIDAHLHYRAIDVSSIKELAKRWFPRAYFNAPSKDGGHRALADILESIRELQYYRRAVFTAEPGVSSDEAKTISAAVVADFSQKINGDGPSSSSESL
ncbi:oligoribonuclease [Humidisolicoccus flavus]|uniref:oligoribonuclease n=1 Tax=Humidisolicoccus flavus TaxID=3111414 RepID=UPI0032543605